MDVGHRVKKRQCLLDCHAQDVGDVLAFVLNLQRFAVVALTKADIAWHVHVRQKVHFDLDHPIALTGFAAASRHVERETTGAVPALACGVGLGHELSDVGKHARVGGGVRARCAANR